MSEHNVLPELKQIIGAMLFVNKTPLSLKDIRKVLVQVGQDRDDALKEFGKATEEDLLAAMNELARDLADRKTGMHVTEMAGGYKLENDGNCGPWLRRLLQKGRPNRLSRPALETLAIIAYRQPAVRSEIEAVRGVAVDQILRNLMEMQLIRVVGRSELPGRPWQFGTTSRFLEHFGLKAVDDLPGIDELRRLEINSLAKAPVDMGQAPESETEETSQVDIEDALNDPNRDTSLPSQPDADSEGAGDAKADNDPADPVGEDEMPEDDVPPGQDSAAEGDDADQEEDDDDALDDDEDADDEEDEYDDDDEDEDDEELEDEEDPDDEER